MKCEFPYFIIYNPFGYLIKVIGIHIKKTASDKNHRPCLPLKPQEKFE